MKRARFQSRAWSALLLLLVTLQTGALACGIRCEAMTLSMASSPAMSGCAMPSMQPHPAVQNSGFTPVRSCDKVCHCDWKLVQPQATHAPNVHWQAVLTLPALQPVPFAASLQPSRTFTWQRKPSPPPSFDPAVTQLRI